MKCGCEHKSAWACAADQIQFGMIHDMTDDDVPVCACTCHDQYTRQAKRLKLKPEEKRNSSS